MIKSPVRSVLVALVCASAIVGIVACQSAAPPAPAPTAPPPSAQTHKLGLSINNVAEHGFYLSELPLITYGLSSDGADAATVLSETVMGLVGPGPNTIAVSSCYIAPQAALTASNTNYATLDLYKRAGDGGAPVLIASASTVITQSDAGSDGAATGNWVAYSNVGLTVVANSFVSPGDELTFLDSKTGTGVSLPQARLHCFTLIQ